MAAKIERCLAVSDADYREACRRRNELRQQYDELFERFDLLLTPTVPMAPPPADVDELTMRELAISYTVPFNAIGAPALALPAVVGGPAGSQVVGAPGRDALVLAAGALFERLSRR